MGKATKVKHRLGYEEAQAELEELRGTIAARAAERASTADQVGQEVKALMAPVLKQRDELLAPVRALEFRVRMLRAREKALQKLVDAGPPSEPLAREMVDNPLRADELVAAEIADGVEQPGRIEVDVRLSARIGGLARLGAHLTEARMVAAAKFRSAWDGAQLGGARAIDYAQTRVDTSPSVGSSEAALALVEDALVVYRDAVQALGQVKSVLLQRVICDELSLRELGERMGRPVGGKATLKLRDTVLEAVDVLVEHFRTGPAPTGRMRGTREGERLPLRREDGATVIVYADSGEVNSRAA